MPKLLTLAAVVAFASIPLLPAQAAPQQGADPLEICMLDGEIIPQPPGSAIQACCTEDGCVICAADWSDCTFDPANNVRPGGAGRPVFDGADTMAPPPRQSNPNPILLELQVVQ